MMNGAGNLFLWEGVMDVMCSCFVTVSTNTVKLCEGKGRTSPRQQISGSDTDQQ